MQPPAPRDRLPNAPLWLLALITFSGTLGMHIFIPALPFAASDLGAGIGEMQLTISLYILGLAFGQLVYGPLSDRFGRRPTLMVGLSIYVVAGLVSAVVPDAHSLIAARLFQALGGCAGMVLGRAIVRDTSTADGSARRLALLGLVVSIGPGLAPVVGGALASTLGWRSIFYFLGAMGVASLVCSWRLLPETGRVGAHTNAATLMRHYGQLLRSPAFLGYAFGGGCTTTAGYAFISAAPFIFVNELHRPAYEVGLYLGSLVVGGTLGVGLASRLIGSVPIQLLLVRASACGVVSTLVFLGAVLLHQVSIASVMVPLFVYMFCSAMGSPASVTLAISVNTRVIGSASGLYGFIQMLVGAVCTALVGLGRDPALSAAIILAVSGVLGQIAYSIAQRSARHESTG